MIKNFSVVDYTDPPPFYTAGSTHYSENEAQVNEDIPPLPQRKEKVRKKVSVATDWRLVIVIVSGFHQ